MSFEESENAVPEENVSSFSDCYKYSGRTLAFTQEKKRQLFLQKQKEKRSEAFDEKRDLSELFTEDSTEPMECESLTKKKHLKKCPFGYKLMGSEWFTEVPDDLPDNWLIKLCPEGIRYLVVANKAITTCYYRNGRSSFTFKSKLPGGNSDCGHKFTVLDCIYNKNVNTLFVYDVLAWNSMSLINAEVQMRFFWLKSKFQEFTELSVINERKNFRFMLVDFFPAEVALLQDHLFTPFMVNGVELSLDGVLFYHKEGHYVFGDSPLVWWLRTFMLAELLNIDVPPIHFQNKPDNYESIQQYLSCRKKKKRSKNESQDSMEMEQLENDCENADFE
ncbi:snurportin-1 [Tribolium madens]|uniref:snurportin-1 n=1 Tax=Tribolium madens TaxID=41895 RepID=UPI001CF73130|nr:snurportin-1 [Tribolium madens]XP_044269921.1 snurportin-1 [Tribolium madens]